MAAPHRHDLESQDSYNKASAQLRALVNLISCGAQDTAAALHDASIPDACWLAAALIDKLDGLFNEPAAHEAQP